jgi:ATP-dependent helicase Lhr and Lhr-like helicase
MTNSPASNCESSSFSLLDPRIQHWIWSAGWTELRDAQERAIPLILNGDRDVIIAATTASGKTEAAFFPILTRLAQPSGSAGVALYVSPLKALINDQFGRLEELTELLGIQLTRWHGDASQQRKAQFMGHPAGCLLITPESLEAVLLRHGHELTRVFDGLQFVIIDELHAFIGSERGKQLQSLLHRIESVLSRKVCRIGLSATLGDLSDAKAYLRPDSGQQSCLVDSKESGQELKVLVKGVVEKAQPSLGADADHDNPARLAITAHLFQVLRGSSNLVFPNSRSEVELYCDRLARLCAEKGVPNEFWPHHGNLSKEIREETEAALKQTERPATAICTSTLELGIDIGPVRSVVQIGPPPSVASLRQRLGRSGRRKGEPMILRAYCIEDRLSSKSSLSDELRENLVQTIAMIRLLARGWYEPLELHKIHASTLVQQILSAVGQYGGIHAQQLWDLLCGKGPFSAISRKQFLSLLRKLGKDEIIFQDATSLLLLAPKGERIIEHYTFYAAFSSDEEYRVVAGTRVLGSLPISRPLVPGAFVIFAGRRWQVISVSEEDKVITVQPASAGTVPGFDGGMSAVLHDGVRREMREVLRTTTPVPFLDHTGQDLLQEARENYVRRDLDHNWIVNSGANSQIILWAGDRVNDTLALILLERGFEAVNEGLCVTVGAPAVGRVKDVLGQIGSSEADPVSIASTVQNKCRAKWDYLLPADLLDASFASCSLDVPGLKDSLARVL